MARSFTTSSHNHSSSIRGRFVTALRTKHDDVGLFLLREPILEGRHLRRAGVDDIEQQFERRLASVWDLPPD